MMRTATMSTEHDCSDHKEALAGSFTGSRNEEPFHRRYRHNDDDAGRNEYIKELPPKQQQTARYSL